VTTHTAPAKIDYVRTIGTVSNSPTGRGFANPVDAVVSPSGLLFVLNRGPVGTAAGQNAVCWARIGTYTLDEYFVGDIGTGGLEDGAFAQPTMMAFDSDANLYVTDERSNRVSIFDDSGKYIGKWGAAGSEKGELNGPAGIAINKNNQVYVVDQHNDRIQKFTTDGDFITSWGTSGNGKGQFNMPWGIDLDSDENVYVADWRNDRIQKFSAQGDFLATFGESGDGEGQLNRPSGVAVDKDGYIFVCDWGNHRIQLFGADGSFQNLTKGSATLSKWAIEFLEANADEAATRATANLTPELPPHFNTPYHIATQTEAIFWGPTSIRLDAEDNLYVTEVSRHRIQIFKRG